MKTARTWRWIVRISWPLLGGAYGAWLGFGGYLRLPPNADSFAMPVALGFFGAFAGIGLVAGALAGALIGGLVETLLRRFGSPLPAALVVATLATGLALWQIAAWVQTTFPGLRAPAAKAPIASTVTPLRDNPRLDSTGEDTAGAHS